VDARPLDSILKLIRGEQFINSTRRVASSQRYAKPSQPAVKFSGALNKMFSRSHGNLFGGFENRNVGRNVEQSALVFGLWFLVFGLWLCTAHCPLPTAYWPLATGH
jgi:hypothetical protein